MSWAENHDLNLEETHFIMSGEQVAVAADLLPSHQTDWEVDRRGNGKVCILGHVLYVSIAYSCNLSCMFFNIYNAAFTCMHILVT